MSEFVSKLEIELMETRINNLIRDFESGINTLDKLIIECKNIPDDLNNGIKKVISNFNNSISRYK